MQLPDSFCSFCIKCPMSQGYCQLGREIALRTKKTEETPIVKEDKESLLLPIPEDVLEIQILRLA